MNGKFLRTGLFIALSILCLFAPGFRYSRRDSDNDTNYSLFKIERSRDADEIYYDVNLNSKGELNTRNPIHIYWIRKTAGGKKEGLTWIQKKFDYGLKYERISILETRFQFVSNIKRSFILKKDMKGFFKVFAIYENNLLEVKKLFIQFDGGTFLSPKISKVELHARIPETGEEVREIIHY